MKSFFCDHKKRLFEHRLVRACSKRYHGHAGTYFEARPCSFAVNSMPQRIGFSAKNAGLPERSARP